jgi:hypothetical protein
MGEEAKADDGGEERERDEPGDRRALMRVEGMA